MRTSAFLVAIPLALSACSASEDVPDTAATATPDGEVTPTPSADPNPDASALTERNDLYIFEFRYPDEAKAEPELARLLNARAAEARSELERQAQDGKDAAEDSGFPFNGYSYRQPWKVVADQPRFLSLSSEVRTFYGGAHDNLSTQSLIWDREEKRAIAPRDVFTSVTTLENALGEKFCAELDSEREKRRGQPVDESSTSDFDSCTKFSDLAILLGSKGGKAFDRIGLIADPYTAGPWAEGKYEITLPVTVEVIDAVKPEYASAFALGS